MPNRRVLITGATGFVGCRLVERLALGSDYQVRALIHRFTGPGLARLCRLPVAIVSADILDPAAVLEAADGCDFIIHLAYGRAGTEHQRREITVKGTENILNAAVAQHAQKLIYFSTASVHGVAPSGPALTESAPYEATTEVYRESKIEAEKCVWKCHAEHGLNTVIFRPPLIYGPYDYLWSEPIIKDIQSGAILINDGDGAANLVYVDNLIDAVFLALDNDVGNGEAFFVVDEDNLTWKQVYEAYARRLKKHPPFVMKSEQEINELIKSRQPPNAFYNWLARPILLIPVMIRACLNSRKVAHQMFQIPWLRFVKDQFPRSYGALKGNETNQSFPKKPFETRERLATRSEDAVKLFASQSRFSNEKIKRILNFKQRISFEEAVDLTFTWAKYQGIVK